MPTFSRTTSVSVGGAVVVIDAGLGPVTRERLLPQLDHPGTLVAAGHFADRVFGRIAPADGRFTWRPYGG